MKRLFISFLMLGTVAIAPPTFAASTATTNAVEPQIRVRVGQPGNRRWNRRSRTYTRIVTIGRYRYRETVRMTYLPNGRTRVNVLSRTRLGRAW
jgi:hypothetical protein